MGVRNVGVDLGGRDIRVAEHELDRTDIRAVLNEMCGERMAEGMRRNVLKPTFRGIFFYETINDLAIQWFAGRRYKKAIDLNVRLLSPGHKIALQPFDGTRPDRDPAGFAAFAGAGENSCFDINTA